MKVGDTPTRVVILFSCTVMGMSDVEIVLKSGGSVRTLTGPWPKCEVVDSDGEGRSARLESEPIEESEKLLGYGVWSWY